jgi:hypothetical protein
LEQEALETMIPPGEEVHCGKKIQDEDHGSEKEGGAEKPIEANSTRLHGHHLPVRSHSPKGGQGGQQGRHGNGEDQERGKHEEEEAKDDPESYPLVDDHLDKSNDLVQKQGDSKGSDPHQEGGGHLSEDVTVKDLQAALSFSQPGIQSNDL